MTRGRPPTGAAMTDAERARRYRQAKRDAAAQERARPHGRLAPGLIECGRPHLILAPPADTASADYPRMLYRADGRTLVAETPEEHTALMAEGWETTPLAVHRQPVVTQHIGTDLAAMLREVLAQVLDERDLSDFVTR